jgi:membrane-associated phospholipid phosphatase
VCFKKIESECDPSGLLFSIVMMINAWHRLALPLCFFKKYAYHQKGIFLFLIFSNSLVQAQEKDTIAAFTKARIDNVDGQIFKINDQLSYQYPKPKFFDFITKVPHDIGLMGSMMVQKDKLIWLGGSIGATAILVPFDQQIVDGSRDFGQRIGFQENHSYSEPLKMFPKNINSGIYRFGNGFTALLVGGGLLVYGLSNNNYRAIHTSSEVMEGLIASGILVQAVKRITGRESPFIAEANGNEGGDWRLFPSFAAYQKNTPSYDAMPSGHLATIMTTVVIFAENYKEVKWIMPVGVGLMTLMSFEMMQSKVHWASDYPLAIFMGYIIGKSIVKSRITAIKNTPIGEKKMFQPKFHYSFSSNQNFTLAGVNITF